MQKAISFDVLLVLFCAFIAVLIGARMIYTGTGHFLFLVWNIFLAAIPYLVSKYGLRPENRAFSTWLVLAAWLLFFPNALYIVTDLVHLQIPGLMPKWYDAILLFSASILGLILGFASLHKVERSLLQLYKPGRVSVLIFLFLFLGSFGVYLGRFMRWNSWDIVADPLGLISGILHRLVYPFEHGRTWGITFVLTGLFYLLYTTIKKMPGYLNRVG